MNTTLTIRYDKIGENRYLRTLQTDEKDLFIISDLNLKCVVLKSDKAVDDDFKKIKKLLHNTELKGKWFKRNNGN